MPAFDTLAVLVEVVENLIPFDGILGCREFRVNDDGVTRIRVDRRDDPIGSLARGYLHGGIISATLDVVGGSAAMMGVVEWFDDSATVLRSGSLVAAVRMEFHYDEGILMAAGSGTYIVG